MTEQELKRRYIRLLVKFIRLRAAVNKHHDTYMNAHNTDDFEYTRYEANKRLWNAAKEPW